MCVQRIRQCPTIDEIAGAEPLDAASSAAKERRDRQLRDIILGRDRRFLVIIGPCSAHCEDAVCEYVSRLAALQERVSDRLFLVPRIYTAKPRTSGLGYKGMLHQPSHRGEYDMSAGIRAARRLHVRALAESGLSGADELLYPAVFPYISDLVSYVAVGARSVENQEHRLAASGLDVPVGMKNPLSGDLGVMADAIRAARHSHVYLQSGWEVLTGGNPLSHGILRGAVDQQGRHIQNWGVDYIGYAARLFEERGLAGTGVIIDASHSNSGKDYRQQPRIVLEVARQRRAHSAARSMVRGVMVESFLVEGAQEPTGDEFGKSITDPCLGWEDSERLILELADVIGV